MDVTIREAHTRDVPSLEILRRQAVEASFSDEYDREQFAGLVATNDDDLTNHVESDGHLVMIAETPVTPVSYAALDRKSAEITALFTSPDYRRNGFGTILLERIENVSRSEGKSAIHVTTPDVAVEFFEANGFEATSPAEWKGIPAMQMQKQL